MDFHAVYDEPLFSPRIAFYWSPSAIATTRVNINNELCMNKVDESTELRLAEGWRRNMYSPTVPLRFLMSRLRVILRIDLDIDIDNQIEPQQCLHLRKSDAVSPFHWPSVSYEDIRH